MREDVSRVRWSFELIKALPKPDRPACGVAVRLRAHALRRHLSLSALSRISRTTFSWLDSLWRLDRNLGGQHGVVDHVEDSSNSPVVAIASPYKPPLHYITLPSVLDDPTVTSPVMITISRGSRSPTVSWSLLVHDHPPSSPSRLHNSSFYALNSLAASIHLPCRLCHFLSSDGLRKYQRFLRNQLE